MLPTAAGGRGGRGLRTYRCRASLASWKGERCDSPTNIMADRLESYLVEQIKQAYLQGGAPGVATSIAGTDGGFEDAQDELEAAERELERFSADPTAAELLGQTAWTAALPTRTERLDAARLAYREQVQMTRAADIVISPVELLDSLEPAELRTVLRSVFASVRISHGSARGRGPVAERVELLFHGEPSPGGSAAAGRHIARAPAFRGPPEASSAPWSPQRAAGRSQRTGWAGVQACVFSQPLLTLSAAKRPTSCRSVGPPGPPAPERARHTAERWAPPVAGTVADRLRSPGPAGPSTLQALTLSDRYRG